MEKHLVKMKFGSHLYGTSTPASDTDIKAVHMEDSRNVFLNRFRSVINLSTAQNKAHGEKNKSTDVDFESYELNKFVNLLCEGQTVALDMLFAPSWAWTEVTPEWELLQKNRSLFLTKKAQSFVGYCRTQANKYGIKGSRVAAAREAVEFFGSLILQGDARTTLREKEVEIKLWVLEKNNEFIKIIPRDPSNPKSEEMIDVCNRKCQWGNSIKSAHEMYKRIFDEYGSRALQAEANEGIDWKALSHAVRIGEQAVELFQTGQILFPRHNAAELLSIKRGERPYNEVASRVEFLLDEVEREAKKSTLPDNVDREAIDNMVYDMYVNNFSN